MDAPLSSAAGPHHVLVVDDDENVAALMGMALRSLGAQVDVVHDLESAMSVLDRDDVHIVLCDYEMPVASTAADLWRATQEREPPVAFMIVTGHRPERISGEFPHSVSILPKPFGIDALQRALQAAVAS